MDIKIKHPTWTRYAARWQMALDFYRGGLEVLSPKFYTEELTFSSANAGSTSDDGSAIDPTPEMVDQLFKFTTTRQRSYLFSHCREKYARWAERAVRAVHFPIMQPIVDAYVAGVLRAGGTWGGKSDPKELSEPWRELLTDANMAGDSLTQVVKDVAAIAAVCGRCHALVWMTEPDGEPNSLYDEQRQGVRAYLRIVTPLDLVNWSTDSTGEFRWIMIQEAPEDTRVPGEDFDPKPVYRVIYPDRWELWGSDNQVLRTGPNRLGRVCLATCWHKRGKDSCQDLDADPLAASLLDVDRDVYNRMSLVQQLDYNQTFSVLAIPSGATGPTALNISVFDAIGYDGRAGMPTYISPNPEMAAGLWSRIKEEVEMVRAAYGRGAGEASSERRGVLTLNAENGDKWATMSLISDNIEAFENQVFEHVASLRRLPTIRSQRVKRFDVAALEQKIDNLLKLGQTVNAESLVPLAKSVLREAMKQGGSDSSEIEEAIDGVSVLDMRQAGTVGAGMAGGSAATRPLPGLPDPGDRRL